MPKVTHLFKQRKKKCYVRYYPGATTKDMIDFPPPYRKKKIRHKISSVQNCHWQNNLSVFADEFFCLPIREH